MKMKDSTRHHKEMKGIGPMSKVNSPSPHSAPVRASGGGDWGSQKMPHKTHGTSWYKGGTKGCCHGHK